MITKMSVVNITGPRDDIDRMADQYLSHYDIHLENTLKELSGIETLRPYTSPNPYVPWIDRIDDLLSIANIDQNAPVSSDASLSYNIVQDLVTKSENELSEERKKHDNLKNKIEETQKQYEMFEPFSEIDFNLEDILQMKKVKYRFGRFTIANYHKFKKYLDTTIPSIFVFSKEEAGYVYGVYFTPAEARQRVDALYYSLAWERIRLPEETGSFMEITNKYETELTDLQHQQNKLETYMRSLILPMVPNLLHARARLSDLSQAWNVRKFAAITRDEFAQKETRYLLIGWMATEDALRLGKEVEDDPNVTLIIEDDKDNEELKPPTKLRNNFFTKPFELITHMYGMPNYHEMDPTGLVAITYSLLFGAMFGDVGHGLLLIVLGLVGYIKPHLALAKMFVPVGISSLIFGFLYGSFFGFEDVIPHIWLNPSSHMTEIPFFGALNTVFIVSIAFGMFLIIATMLLNIRQRIKMGDTLEGTLDKNGILGLVFYGILVLMIVLYMTGHVIPLIGLFIFALIVSLLLIAFKEQIIRHIEHKSGEAKDGIVIQLLTVFFETFETLLTYFSNTISFVRVGAFAISHGAMMSVVLMLAGTEAGHTNWIVIILGNLFVVGFEGMIVFIQVLRLEFYEIFSHFFSGDGIEFKSIWSLY